MVLRRARLTWKSGLCSVKSSIDRRLTFYPLDAQNIPNMYKYFTQQSSGSVCVKSVIVGAGVWGGMVGRVKVVAKQGAHSWRSIMPTSRSTTVYPNSGILSPITALRGHSSSRFDRLRSNNRIPKRNESDSHRPRTPLRSRRGIEHNRTDVTVLPVRPKEYPCFR